MRLVKRAKKGLLMFRFGEYSRFPRLLKNVYLGRTLLLSLKIYEILKC